MMIPSLDKVRTMVKRFSFVEKMAWSSLCARKLCPDWMFDVNAPGDFFLKYPWTVEPFAMIAVTEGEWGLQALKQDSFMRMLSGLWNSVPFDRKADPEMVIGQYIYRPQYMLRKDPRIYLSRFYYIFTHDSVRLDRRFEEKFKVPYLDAIAVANMIYAMENSGENCMAVLNGLCVNKAIEFDVRRLVAALRIFVLNRSDFAERQRAKWNSAKNILLAENMLNTYPFIEYGHQIHFPVPYLMRYASTYGLFHRVVPIEDGSLRSDVGKKILEEYVLKLLRYSGAYDYVLAERVYTDDSSSLSPDAICISGDKCLLVEVKLKEPDDKLRSLNRKDRNTWVSAAYEALSQLWRNFQDRRRYLDCDYDQESVFGVVVVFEDAGIELKHVFGRFERFHPDADMDFVRRHFKIVELYDLELICARKQSLLDVMLRCSGVDDCNRSRIYEVLPAVSYQIPFLAQALDSSVNTFLSMMR